MQVITAPPPAEPAASEGSPLRDRLEELAIQLARNLQRASGGAAIDPIPARLRQLVAHLSAVEAYFEQATLQQTDTSPASEWVLDNHYVIEQAARLIADDLPGGFYRRLPRVSVEGAEIPRVAALAGVLILASGGRIEIEQLAGFVTAFQSVTPIEIGEIWALPLLLRLGVLEALSTSLSHITRIVLAAPPFPDMSSLAAEQQVEVPRPDDEALVVNSILSLRTLATQNWTAFFESVSLVEQILSDDPAGVYSHMHTETRDWYRKVVERLARLTSTEESAIAREALDLARAAHGPREGHVGYYLIGEGLASLEARLQYRQGIAGRIKSWLGRHTTALYLGSIMLLTLALAAAAGVATFAASGSQDVAVLAGLLTFWPASALVMELINGLVGQLVRPRVLPRLAFEQGLPDDCRTIVVIPALLTNLREFGFLLGQLENHYLGNSDPNLRFALLTDFSDAPQKSMPGEDEILTGAEEAVERLNDRYAEDGRKPFMLFHRERVWNASENCWMGWERKRGKLAQFNALVRHGEAGSYTSQVGDQHFLPWARFIITLDADTALPRDSARRLVATLAHPLNRAVFDARSGKVTAGYTVLQPRVQVRPSVANLSLFTRVFSGDTTIDLYTRAVSDVYQDLFGEAIFVGKGIYDIEAFERSLAGRVPENALLSHDLFEGMHGRCGLATNVVLFEDYPANYLSYAHRANRWIRGDWQLLPWLVSKVPGPQGTRLPTRFSVLDRWKILDNLRRSMVAPGILTMLICSWLLLPGPAAAWTVLAISPYLTNILLRLLGVLRSSRFDDNPGAGGEPARSAAWRALLQVVFLPYEALIALDAISITIWRKVVTRRGLLEWTTAARVNRLFGGNPKLGRVWAETSAALAFALAVGGLVLWLEPSRLAVALPFLAAWVLSPYTAMRISQPRRAEPDPISLDQARELRLLARKTWLFFEESVGPDDHWLPPDHFQEDPLGLVAHRTSPTNIGLLLLSTLAACDFGYIGPRELMLRLRSTLDGMDLLEKQRGHLLNWYDTRTLSPLPGRYISTVDSGNLAASLLVLGQACADIPTYPVVRWVGLVDTLDALDSTVREAFPGPPTSDLHAVISNLKSRAERLRDAAQVTPGLLQALFVENRAELEELLVRVVEDSGEGLRPDLLRQLSTWIGRSRNHLSNLQRDLETLTPWIMALASPPAPLGTTGMSPEQEQAWSALCAGLPMRATLEQVPGVCSAGREALGVLRAVLGAADSDALDWCNSLEQLLERARVDGEGLLTELGRTRERAEAWFDQMHFGFLFDAQREVFHIGFNLDTGRLDANHYDLLASEARITSLVAIARGDIPQRHWLSLARPITQVDGQRVLLSWSGTMFEYLMPALFAESYPDTLLDQSCRAAIGGQITYAQSKRVPWGISESSYYHFDSSQVYQYRAFGMPGLGYKRDLGRDLVIAPYASLLALPFAPRAVLHNLQAFHKMDMFGPYGLYESVDFTSARLGTGLTHARVRTYMAHHQGMILVSLGNFLHERTMVRRFHRDPRIGTVQLLLREQIPGRASIEYPHPHEIGALHPIRAAVSLDPWTVEPGTAHPQVHFLSNGSYGVLISAMGGGFSRWGKIDLTRWRADPTLECYGSWLYVVDRDTGQIRSASLQPTGVSADRMEVRFYPHAAEFMRRDGDLSLRMRIAVLTEADVELRRITITNHGDHAQHLSLISYGEVVLAAQDLDQRQPAFNKLFIESEFVADGNILLFRRRLKSADEKPVFMAHFAVNPADNLEMLGYETDRARFIGRGGNSRLPAALHPGSAGLTRTTGATLDPIFAMQTGVVVQPGESLQLAFVTLAASSRAEALALATRYRNWRRQTSSLDDNRSQVEAELSQLGLDSPQLEQVQRLLSGLIYPDPVLRANPATIGANTLAQPGLWPFAISGDYPILLVSIGDEGHLPLLRELLRAHRYWRRRGLLIDLVVLNRLEAGYQQNLQGKILQALSSGGSDQWLNRRGGVFVLRAEQLAPQELTLLETAARVVLDGAAGSLRQQLARAEVPPVRLPPFVASKPPTEVAGPAAPERPELRFDNGLGGFSEDGLEYVIYLRPGEHTPLAWVNILANPDFGCLVSEAGLGFTWAGNSGENRLTPWRSDPLLDPPAEAIYLRDEDTGQIWSPTPGPARAPAPYLVRHGHGYSIFEHNSYGLKQQLRVFVPAEAPVKIVHLRLENSSQQTRRINVTYYAEWVLGTTHEEMAPFIVPEFISELSALLAHNPYNQDFGRERAFLAATRELHALTGDRTEFLGSGGGYERPAALERVGLTATAQAGSDACTAMQVLLWLAPGEAKEVSFLLGQAQDRDQALEVIARYQDAANIEAAWQGLSEFWKEKTGGIQVRTPDAALDLLINHWLPYQTLSCRLWGRSALYQSGGAYGFRDQLQDVLAFLHTHPELAREQILRAARHQFEEGDVLHWWHPPSGRGLRNRISDNLLWLPFATAEYIKATGDNAILDEKVPFLVGEPLQNGENERYGLFQATSTSNTLYEHCRRALSKGATVGPHGLPLMGLGDWNDGMNHVGVKGTGESIWLGWFLYATLLRFADLADARPGSDHAGQYRSQAEALRAALADSAWDGAWFRRAYFDDGSPLGSAQSKECQIDSLSQSWAVISGAAEPARAREALESLYERLVDTENALILLLAPPFDRTARDPGYIKGYLPGTRENGGQYTHAAIWAIYAYAQLGQGDRAGQLLRLINPIYHSDTPAKADRYKVEPYVLAADVYSLAPHQGRGGWSWYTGSSGWMLRTVYERILGLQRTGSVLKLAPCIPGDWPGFELDYCFGNSLYRIRVENPRHVNGGVQSLTVDGRAVEGGQFELQDDGRLHLVNASLG